MLGGPEQAIFQPSPARRSARPQNAPKETSINSPCVCGAREQPPQDSTPDRPARNPPVCLHCSPAFHDRARTETNAFQLPGRHFQTAGANTIPMNGMSGNGRTLSGCRRIRCHAGIPRPGRKCLSSEVFDVPNRCAARPMSLGKPDDYHAFFRAADETR